MSEEKAYHKKTLFSLFLILLISLVFLIAGCSSSCFLAGTKITMADGLTKNIEDVIVGDKVLSIGESSNIVASVVAEIESPIRKGYYSVYLDDGTILNVTNEHPLYFKNEHYIGWGAIKPLITLFDTAMPVKKIKKGDSLYNIDGKWKKIVDIVYVKGDVKTYNLKEVSGSHTFFAEGILAHNKGTVSDYKGCYPEGTSISSSAQTCETRYGEKCTYENFGFYFTGETGAGTGDCFTARECETTSGEKVTLTPNQAAKRTDLSGDYCDVEVYSITGDDDGDDENLGGSTPSLFLYIDGNYLIENDIMNTFFQFSGMTVKETEEAYVNNNLGITYSENEIYMLKNKPTIIDSKLKLQIKELEPEESQIDQVQLIKVVHDKDTIAFVSDSLYGEDNNIHNAKLTELKPISCVDENNKDCLFQIMNEDENYLEKDKGDYIILKFKPDMVDNNYLYINSWINDFVPKLIESPDEEVGVK